MVRLAYNLLLAVLAPAAIPYWILRGRAKGRSWGDIGRALGIIPPLEHTIRQPSVWFHAVSVGEVQSCVPFLQGLRRALPAAAIYVSAGTATGLGLARERLRDLADGVFPAPADFPWCVARVLRRLEPRLLVVAETELWPNYFFQAKRFGAATLIVNGRLSDRSAPRYRRLRHLFRSVLGSVDAILVQSETDRDRFLGAGADAAVTLLGGNLKYDFDSDASAAALPPAIDAYLKAARPDLVLVAGSTREGEEAMLVPALRSIAERTPRCLAVVAPRHPHRFGEAARELQAVGVPVLRRSRLVSAASTALPAVLLLDSLGELASLYARCDLAFVGGSLNGWGGHNVLEPVRFAKPVVVGPYMQNFRTIATGLAAAGGLLQVKSADDLPEALARLAADRIKREALGRTGRAFAFAQRGASEKAADQAKRLFAQALPRRPPSTLALAALGLPSALWSALALLRRKAYDSGVLAVRRLAVPVVSVGNLTVGGTGKTPAVSWLVERLRERGLVTAVLTRGYGRRDESGLRVVRAGDAADPREVGDEPAMLARRFASTAPETRIAVCADRFAAGRALEAEGGIDVFVLDDGFQHMQLHRNLDLVLVDAIAPFGNGYALPLGRLREAPGALLRADAVLITRCNAEFDHAALCRTVREMNPDARVYRSRMATNCLVELATGREESPELAAGKRVAAFCGIGNPRSFFGQVRSIGCEIVSERTFRDHYSYTAWDIDTLCQAARKSGAEAMITTAKDAINLAVSGHFKLPAYALHIELEVEHPSVLIAQIARKISRSF